MGRKAWRSLVWMILPVCILVLGSFGCSSNYPVRPGDETGRTGTEARTSESTAPMTSDDGSVITLPSGDTLVSGGPSPTEAPTLLSVEPEKLADNRTPAERLITKKYSIQDLSRFTNYFSERSHSGNIISLQSFQELFQIECMRSLGNNEYYTVFFPEEGGRIFFFFCHPGGGAGGNTYYLDRSVYIRDPLEKSDFIRLKKGDSFNTVLQRDPGLQYALDHSFASNLFVSGDPLYSVHLFADSLLLITWESSDPEFADPDAVFIRDMTWFDDRRLDLDLGPNLMINGTYNFAVLPMDYPQ